MKVLSAVSIALLFAVLLSTANKLTSPAIDKNKKAYEGRQLTEMIGGRELRVSGQSYKIFESGQLFGYVKATSTRHGYNGDIHLLIAYDLSGQVLAVRVTGHRETPGLGDAIEGKWIETFTGKRAASTIWALSPEGDFDGITGATITSRALINAVAEVLNP